MSKIDTSAFFGAMENLKQVVQPSPMSFPHIDKRTRQERKEDFEQELLSLTKTDIEELIKWLNEFDRYDENYISNFNGKIDEIIICLTKFSRFYSSFELLNSEEVRRLDFIKKENKVKAWIDWKDKARTFFFRALASVLFIATIFIIGYLEKNYEWAVLPLAKYVEL